MWQSFSYEKKEIPIGNSTSRKLILTMLTERKTQIKRPVKCNKRIKYELKSWCKILLLFDEK